MAATTPHPSPLPPPIHEDDDHGIYQPEGPPDWQLFGCTAALVCFIFVAGVIIGALWL